MKIKLLLLFIAILILMTAGNAQLPTISKVNTPIEPHLRDIVPLGKDTICLVSGLSYSNPSYVISKDSCKTWTTINSTNYYIGFGNGLLFQYVVNGQTLEVKKSNDAIHWEPSITLSPIWNNPEMALNIMEINNQLILICGDSLFLSTDSATTWNYLFSADTIPFYDAVIAVNFSESHFVLKLDD